MTTDKYILRGKKVVVENDIYKWGKWVQKHNRQVKQTKIKGAFISTIFLGLDHSFGDGPPLLFETMIFGGKYDDFQDRYPTWDDAVAGHKKAVEFVKSRKD